MWPKGLLSGSAAAFLCPAPSAVFGNRDINSCLSKLTHTLRNKDPFTMRMPHHELITFRGHLLLIYPAFSYFDAGFSYEKEVLMACQPVTISARCCLSYSCCCCCCRRSPDVLGSGPPLGRPAAMPLACLTLTLLPHQPVPLEVPLPQLL